MLIEIKQDLSKDAYFVHLEDIVTVKIPADYDPQYKSCEVVVSQTNGRPFTIYTSPSEAQKVKEALAGIKEDAAHRTTAVSSHGKYMSPEEEKSMESLLQQVDEMVSRLHEETRAGEKYRNIKSVDIRFEIVETQDPSGEYDSRLAPRVTIEYWKR